MENLELSKATLTDIVFEDRNKQYGAFILRKLYDRNVLIALGIASALFCTFFLISLARVLDKEVPPPPAKKKQEDLTIIDVPLDNTIQKPDQALFIEPPKIEKIKYTAYVPEEDEQIKEPPKSNKEFENKNTSTENQDGEDIPVPEGGGEDLAKKINDIGPTETDEIFMGMVSKQASFPGGMGELNKFVNARLSTRTKEYITDRQVKGKMFVNAIIGKDGSLTDVKLNKGLSTCPPCNEEIVEIIKQSPAWEAAEANGYKQKVRISIPITF